ncbi:hypothetical protein IAQ61_010393, partial [Plenodomus lingam]|uniref:Predicted protein n=1 Tax=Leptosphaeria maculans (strain JN3 / isolate v23.1.3 / race Av1-4-5-6-7-8) TaxID=985895 RepID=E5A3T1_LEPMJ
MLRQFMMNHLLESGHCLILLALGLDQFTLGDVERKMGAFGRTIGSAAWAVLSRDRQLDLLLTVYLLCNKAGRSMIIGVVFEVDCAAEEVYNKTTNNFSTLNNSRQGLTTKLFSLTDFVGRFVGLRPQATRFASS